MMIDAAGLKKHNPISAYTSRSRALWLPQMKRPLLKHS